MRVLASIVFVLLVLAFAPRTAEAQPCQTFSLPSFVTLTGTLSAADCSVLPTRNSRGELWNVYATAGETMVITMNRGTMADPYLYLLNPSGVLVASNDDGGAAGTRNARIQYVATVTGAYQIIATSFAQLPATDFGTYEIRYDSSGNVACQARSLSVNTTTNGTLDTTDCFARPYRSTSRGEIWNISAVAGATIEITMTQFTVQDPYLILLDDSWQELARNDDFSGRDSRITYVATYTGTYRVIATTFGATDLGAYSIRYGGTVVVPPSGIPGPPGQPTVTVSGTQVTIAWGAPTTGATPILEYLLEAGTFSGGSNLGTFSLGTFTSVVASVANGTYYVRVRARNAFGTGPASPERSFSVGIITILQPPRDLTVSVSGRRVTLTWLAPTDGVPDLYRVEAGTAPGSANLGFADVPGLPPSISVDNVPPGLYYIRVRAVRGGVSGPPSNEVPVLVF